MGYINTTYVEFWRDLLAQEAKRGEEAIREAEEHRAADKDLDAYWKAFCRLEDITRTVRCLSKILDEAISRADEPFRTKVDVYIDDRCYEGWLDWDFELEYRAQQIQSLVMRPLRLELENGELPDFVRDKDFHEVFLGTCGDINWYIADKKHRILSIAPRAVYIWTEDGKILVEFELT